MKNIRLVTTLQCLILTIVLSPESALSATQSQLFSQDAILEKLYKGEGLQIRERLLEDLKNNLSDVTAFQLGCVAALSGEYEEAEEYFTELIKTKDKVLQGFSYFNLGGIYYIKALKNLQDRSLAEKASKYLYKAYSLLPNNTLAYDLSYSSFHLGDRKEKSSMMTIDPTGLPPDSSIFSKRDPGLGYVFDSSTAPPLYFYESSGYLLLSQNDKKVCSVLENSQKKAELIPQETFRNDILGAIADIKEQCNAI